MLAFWKKYSPAKLFHPPLHILTIAIIIIEQQIWYEGELKNEFQRKKFRGCNNFEPFALLLSSTYSFFSRLEFVDVYSNNFSRTSLIFPFESLKSKAIASNAWFIAYLYRLKIIKWEKTGE